MIVETTRPRVVRAARLGWVFLDCGDDDCGDDDCGDDTPSYRSGRQTRLHYTTLPIRPISPISLIRPISPIRLIRPISLLSTIHHTFIHRTQCEHTSAAGGSYMTQYVLLEPSPHPPPHIPPPVPHYRPHIPPLIPRRPTLRRRTKILLRIRQSIRM